MALQRITVYCRDWQAVDVTAAIFGQMAVHRSTHAQAWTVTHVKSGLWVAAFTALHVACSFARKVNSEFDLSPIVEVSMGRREPTPEEKMVFDVICRLRHHECYTDEGAIPLKVR